MAERALDAVIVSDSNLAWLTGYDGWSFYVRPAPPGHLVRQMIHRMTLSGLNKMIGIAYDMITPAGAENLCAAPRKLVIKP